MTTVTAECVRLGDVIDVPTTLTGTVIGIVRHGDRVGLTIRTPDGEFAVTHYRDAEFALRQMGAAESDE